MYNYSSSSPVLTDVTISNNTSTGNGGGMYNEDHSSPVLTNVIISNNTHNNGNSGGGGGMFNDNYSSPVLTNVVISGNTSSWSAGGMENHEDCSPVLTNVIIYGNSASTNSFGGGMLNVRSSLVLTNVLIAGNVAGAGGGMSNETSSLVLTNVTISGNKASTAGRGGGIYNNSSASDVRIRNSIIWGNTAGSSDSSIEALAAAGYQIAYSIVQGSTGSGDGWSCPKATNGGGNAADPGTGSANSPFVDWQDPADSGVTMPNSEGDYRLKSGSPAYNVGSDALYPDTWSKWTALFGNPDDNPITEAVYTTYVLPALLKDVGGNPRLNSTIDMGAYEKE
jgi:hypothetical protein